MYDEDWEILERYFGSGAPRHRRVGCSNQCREYIHEGVLALRRRIAEAMLEAETMEDDMELEDVE